MKKGIRKIVCLLLSLIIAAVLSGSTFAEASDSSYDASKKGSISLSFFDNETGEPINDAVFLLYKVGNIKAECAALEYDTTAEFKNFNLNSFSLDDPDLADELNIYISENELSGAAAVTENGELCFSDLEPGLYFIRQEESAPGYYEATPFIVAVPMTSPDGTSWIYDVHAEPKVEAFDPGVLDSIEFTVLKKWDVAEEEDILPSVKVALLCDGTVVSTIELSEEENWTHTWTGLNNRKSWTVQEIDVPSDYKVTYAESENTIVITNSTVSAPVILGIETDQHTYLAAAMAFILLMITVCIVLKRGRHFSVEKKKNSN